MARKIKPSIRVFFDEATESLRLKFKQLAAGLDIPMSQRLLDFIRTDVAHWEKTGKPLDLERFNVASQSDHPECIGHPKGKTIADQIPPPGKDREKLAEDSDISLNRLNAIATGEILPTVSEAIDLAGSLGLASDELLEMLEHEKHHKEHHHNGCS